ncbi:M56 family metallopeptidase [Thermosediminibacter oceani]|uniref:Peptidase M56 BlaR1 n=1 Tax=Thermosediminibacter oceani (strain ATCC BAA-1034 / DSM 16646 / JW/IW-1228P) TaxID=555079 RepID=D9S0U7_THEOJ|nr:M56 family metallopeptidase [Thermosediminibacter oceani]ADL07111.1 peptidase M56 BlaR1 [Thermosediminibacter oceani DSM 16646]
MNDIYNQLFIMSVVAGGIYLILKVLSAVTLKYFSAAWHYYTNIAVYMFFLLPYHRWMSGLDLSFLKMSDKGFELPSITGLNPLTALNFAAGGISQQKGYAGASVYFEILPYILMAGTLIFMVVILVHNYNLNRRIFRICRLTDDMQILEVLFKCKQQMGITRQIPVYISPCITTPFLYGIIKPRIVLPDIKLSADELQCVFLHELTHWKRRDGWLKFLMLFINAIHWFNPLAYAARFDIDRFCELSCDESVVKSMSNRERRRYCELMLSVLWNVADQSAKLFSAFSGKRKQLERRVDIILKDKVPMSKKWVRMVATAITLAIVLLGAILAGAVETSALERKGSSESALPKPKEISNYQYRVNEYGETYGPAIYAEVLGEEPDLIAAIGIDGTFGYVRSSDLNPPDPRTPEEAVAQNNLGDKLIPLYDKDGRTVIGQFKIVSGRFEKLK